MPFKFNPFTGTLDLVNSSSSGGITGPGTTTTNTIPTWGGTTGASLLNNSSVYIDTTGNFLGLDGATAPTRPLHIGNGANSGVAGEFAVASYTGTGLHYQSILNANQWTYWYVTANASGIGTHTATPFKIFTNNSDAAVFDSSQGCTMQGNLVVTNAFTVTNGPVTFPGNLLNLDTVNSRVGIKTATPAVDLHVGAGGNVSFGGAAVLASYLDTSAHAFALKNNNTTAFLYIDGTQCLIGTTTATPVTIKTNNANRLTINSGGDGTWAFDTTTGFKFGTGTTQKIGFYNKAPIAQQANTAGAVTSGGTYTATEQAMLNDAYSVLRNLGLLS